MPFLRDDSLTFHRFTPTEVPSIGATPISHSPAQSTSSSEPRFYDRDVVDSAPRSGHSDCHRTMGASKHKPHQASPNLSASQRQPFGSAATSGKELSSFPTSVWTTNTGTLNAVTSHGHHHNSLYKNSYTMDANDFQYIPSSSAGGSVSERRKSSPLQNGSTTKLVLADDDQTNKQVSIHDFQLHTLNKIYIHADLTRPVVFGYTSIGQTNKPIFDLYRNCDQSLTLFAVFLRLSRGYSTSIWLVLPNSDLAI